MLFVYDSLTVTIITLLFTFLIPKKIQDTNVELNKFKNK